MMGMVGALGKIKATSSNVSRRRKFCAMLTLEWICMSSCCPNVCSVSQMIPSGSAINVKSISPFRC